MLADQPLRTYDVNTATPTSFLHCADMVRRCDEDRWLAANYAPASVRFQLHALYALHAEVNRIPVLVSEPPLGEIRLQWWRESLNEVRVGKTPRAHPVVQAIAASAFLSDGADELLTAAIGARTRLPIRRRVCRYRRFGGVVAPSGRLRSGDRHDHPGASAHN